MVTFLSGVMNRDSHQLKLPFLVTFLGRLPWECAACELTWSYLLLELHGGGICSLAAEK